MVKFDEIDSKIISILSENGRITLVDLAKETGLSRIAVKARLDALIEKNVIEKFTIVLNPQQVGRNLTLSLDIQVLADCFEEACRILKENQFVHKLYQVTGDCRLHAHAMLPGTDYLDDFLHSVVYVLPGLVHADFNIIVSRIKDDSEVRI